MKLFSKNDSALIPRARLRRADLAAFANLPRAYRAPDRRLQDPEQLAARLSGLAAQPERLLGDVRHLLIGYNLQRLRPERREQLTGYLLQTTYPVIARIHDKYQARSNSLPEGTERREALTAAIGVVEQLGIAWKHLYRETWSREPRRYRRQRDDVCRHAIRVLEMLLLEQRLRALRYQKLPRSAWVDVNHVFFAQILHDDVDTPLPLTGTVGLRRRSGKAGQPAMSLRDLYLSLQLFGVLDVSSWPTTLFTVPDTYLETLEAGIVLRADAGGELPPGCLITWLNHDAPPLFERPDSLQEPALLFDYTGLYNRLVQDYEAIARMKFLDAFDERRISTPLRRVAPDERIPLLQMMLGALRKRARRTRRHAVVSDNRIPVWFGLGEVAALLAEQAPPALRQMLHAQDLRDHMARLSRLAIGETLRERESHWQLLNFSAGGILISALEGEFGQPVTMGQLVAFRPSGEASELSVGFVCRLNRPQDRVVEVGITRLATGAEMAILEMPGDGPDRRVPALLLHDLAGDWQILCEPDDRLQPGMPVKLVRGDGTAPARLGELRLSKKEFTLFELRSPGLQRKSA